MSMSTLFKPVVGLADGVFDLFHFGHVRYLELCKLNCDYLIVAIANDDYAKSKGRGRPVIGQNERLEIVSAIKFVDKAFICDGSVNTVNEIMPDVYFKCLDYKRDERLNNGIKLIQLPRHESTTDIIKRIKIGCKAIL